MRVRIAPGGPSFFFHINKNNKKENTSMKIDLEPPFKDKWRKALYYESESHRFKYFSFYYLNI